MLKSQDEEVLTLWSSMKIMRRFQKKKKMKRSSSLGKRVHQERRTVHSIKLGRKEIHQGEIRFWKSIKLWEKREGYEARKDFNQNKNKKEEREREKSECRNFHQIMREYWFIKRHEKREIPWKIIQVVKDEKKWRFIKCKIQLNWGRWGKEKSKTYFIKKSVFSQVKKNESALERIRGHQGEMQIHPGKMEVCQIKKKKKKLQLRESQ